MRSSQKTMINNSFKNWDINWAEWADRADNADWVVTAEWADF